MISSRTMVGAMEPIEKMIGPLALKRVLRDVDLPEAPLYSPRHYIPQLGQLALFDAVSQELRENFSLLLAPHVSISTFGKFFEYVSAPETLIGALHLAGVMMPYHCSYDRLSVHSNENFFYLRYHAVLRNAPGYHHYAVLAARILDTIGENYFQVNNKLKYVGFEFSKPSHSLEYENLFQCEIRYDQPALVLAYDRAAMSCTQLKRKSHLTTMKDVILECMIPAPNDSLGAINALVRAGIEEGTVEMEHIARQLGLGERTLRRRLDENGISYRDLVLKARIDRAAELIIETDIPMTEIAMAVGYSDSAHFGRAFKKLTGMVPTEVRRARRTNTLLQTPHLTR